MTDCNSIFFFIDNGSLLKQYIFFTLHGVLKNKKKRLAIRNVSFTSYIFSYIILDFSGGQIHQESSFSSYLDSDTYEEIEEPHNDDSTLSDELQMEHVGNVN